jgi:hypothetical protein
MKMSTYKQITSTSGYFLPEEERRSVHQHWARGSSPSPSPSGWAAPACTAGTPAANRHINVLSSLIKVTLATRPRSSVTG